MLQILKYLLLNLKIRGYPMVKFIRNRADIQQEISKAKEFLSKSTGEYNQGDVLKALNLIFYGKCYLCENSHPTTYNIEHFIPHKKDVTLKLDWNNLFLACGHCNNIKSDKYNNILDCTKVHPDKHISFEYLADIFNKNEKSIIIKALNDDISTLNTVELLNNIYYGNTVGKEMSATNIRWLLHEEMIKFKEALQTYLKHLQVNDTLAIEDDVFLLKHSLDCSTSFTAFKRWYVIINKETYPILYDYLINEVYSLF